MSPSPAFNPAAMTEDKTVLAQIGREVGDDCYLCLLQGGNARDYNMTGVCGPAWQQITGLCAEPLIYSRQKIVPSRPVKQTGGGGSVFVTEHVSS